MTHTPRVQLADEGGGLHRPLHLRLTQTNTCFCLGGATSSKVHPRGGPSSWPPGNAHDGFFGIHTTPSPGFARQIERT